MTIIAAGMTFAAGTKVGPYEIVAHLGAGGQGEVYKARDARLNRLVALKVLPESLSQHPDMKARFEREARTLASLSHPHICPVFDVGRQDGVDYLVMEYIDGETLAERLKNKRLPLDDALRVAIEIADALDKAHRQGIAHRDVKPANIMLTKTGAKLLDFGLAKAGIESSISSSVSQMPTNAAVTGQGTILGTLQYMSPEQLEGREADARSDIFGFGATLYEMVTGARAFDGKSQVSLMAAILEHEPRSISSLAPLTPPLLEKIVQKCLAKDPDNRWQSASDVIEALDWIRAGTPAPSSAMAAPVSNRWKLAALGASTLAVTAAIFAALLFLRKTADTPLWVSLIPPDTNFSAITTLAVSPDGKRIIYSAPNASGANALWVRSIDSADARELPGTVGGILPFWSPDSRSIGFFDFPGGKLERVDIAGGAPQLLAPAANPRGGSWSSDGTILFVPAPTSEMLKIPASGGTPVGWKERNPSSGTFEAPHFLPDGKHFLYFAFDVDPQKQGLYAASLDASSVKRISGVVSKGEYANGYIFYCKGRDLFAQPFDAGKLELQGEAVRVASNIGVNYGDVSNRAFSIAAAGTLAFTAQTTLATSQLTWFDRSGKQLERVGDPGFYFGFAVSPDGKKVALETSEAQTGETGIWLLELANGIASKLTTGGNINTPTWAADGERIIHVGAYNVIQAFNVGSGRKESLIPAADEILGAYVQSASPDGRYLVWTKSSNGQSDPWIAPLDGSRKPERFLQTPYNEFRAQISPDGRWIAYVSNESGSDEVMVESFPKPGQRKRVSPDGGAFPQWGQDGRDLYYLAPASGQRRKLMVVHAETGSTFSASRPEFLFETPPLGDNPRRGQFAPFGKGDRFLLNLVVQETKPRAITLVLNWPSLLKP